jgi:hypothetical protein
MKTALNIYKITIQFKTLRIEMFKQLISSISKDSYKGMIINKTHKKKHKLIWAWKEEESPRWYQAASKDLRCKTIILMPINRNKLKVKVTIKWLVNVKVYGIKPNPFKEMINKKVQNNKGKKTWPFCNPILSLISDNITL